MWNQIQSSLPPASSNSTRLPGSAVSRLASTQPVAPAAGLCAALGAPASAQEKTTTVFAAASMKNALDDVNAAFLQASGTRVVTSYAASSALAKQIEQGAPADVFISADTEWMDYS